jgi:hypothetical protein
MSRAVWGPATWYVLHCMVLKLNDNAPPPVLEKVKVMISRIAANLPCPTCSSHATSYLKQNNFSKVQTLPELRMFMFVFHNKVNERLKKPTLTYEEHVTLYNSMMLSMVLTNMMTIYKSMNQTSVTMMLYSYHRTSMIKDVNVFFAENQSYYHN